MTYKKVTPIVSKHRQKFELGGGEQVVVEMEYHAQVESKREHQIDELKMHSQSLRFERIDFG